MPNVFTAGVAIFLGVISLANGVFMTVSPEPWYWMVPGVPDRGPFNQHFLRDIGIIYALIGVAFISGASFIKQRFALWLMPTAWLAGHAIFHIWEVLVGICGPEALIVDFGGVTFPALVGLALVYSSYKAQINE